MKRFGKIPAALRRGFTLVELMVVLAVTVIGLVAVLHLQTSLLRGTSNSWDMTGATFLARNVLETIKIEGLEWYNDSGLGLGGVQQAKFVYLDTVGAAVAGSGSGWQKAPFENSAAAFQLVNQLGDHAGVDDGALGEITNNINRRYCVQYRVTWIVPNYLIRAEVRVMWLRAEGLAGNYDACPADMFTHPEDIYSISMPMTVMKNVFVAP